MLMLLTTAVDSGAFEHQRRFLRRPIRTYDERAEVSSAPELLHVHSKVDVKQKLLANEMLFAKMRFY